MMPIARRPAQPYHIAVVGCGFFSQHHLAAWQSLPDAKVVALCDIDLEKANTLGRRFGVSATFTDLATLLAKVECDVVDIVTTPAAQSELLKTLYGRGLTVICQKPLGTSYGQAKTFAHDAALHGQTLVVHENFRFMPWFREIRRCIDAGQLGALHSISFRLRPGDGQGADAYLDRQAYFQTMPRLLVAETGIHFIDTFRYLMGEVTAVSARLRRINPAIAAEDAAHISFEFDSGSAGLFDGNRLNSHPAQDPRRTFGEMWLEGANGVMRLDGDGRLWWTPHQGMETQHLYPPIPDTAFGGACAALQAHVLNALTQGTAFENTAQDYLRNIVVQEAVYASHASGSRIVLRDFEPPSTALPLIF